MFQDCYPQLNPLDVCRAHIAEALAGVTGVVAEAVYPLIQRPQTLAKGDLILATAALRIKAARPEELAARWAGEFPESDVVEKPVASGVFLTFNIKPAALFRLTVPEILRSPTWGHNPLLGLKNPDDPSQRRKRIVIEFSSPNIAKPFHQGHLRSTIIGGFLSNIYEGAGWDVVRLNYLGDWGKQYGLLALGFKMFGDAKSLEDDAIHHLYQVYVKINGLLAAERDEIKRLEDAGEDASKLKADGLDEQARRYFKAMCDNDREAIEMWSKFRALSVERYKAAYARLNIRFDEYLGESMVTEASMTKAQERMAEKGLAELSEGATIVDFAKHIPGKAGKSLGKALVRKKDGTSLYLTRDIGALLEREEKFKFDKMIYVVASDQNLHLQQLFKIIELLGYDEIRPRISHVDFGLVLGMSTRRGTVVFLDDVLRDVGEKMHEVMKTNEAKYAQVSDPERTADVLGISSVMVQDMSGKRINNYHFNIDVMTSFEGDTGPYLQYSHARLCSIFNKAGVSISDVQSADLSLLPEPHAISLARVLVQFPDMVQHALRTLEPTTILTYLFRLTHELNSSYDVLRVIGSEPEVMKARLALYGAVRCVLGNGMRILGLTPLDRYVDRD